MGRQSARIYFNMKDHKDIYFDGHYHKAMYIGAECVWYKIEEGFFSFKVQDHLLDISGNVIGKGIALNMDSPKIDSAGTREILRFDWGDGTIEEIRPFGNITHEYPTSDGTEYEVKVYGNISDFNGTARIGNVNCYCITEILSPLPKTLISSLEAMFANCITLKKIIPQIFYGYLDNYETINVRGVFANTSIEYVPELIFSGLYSADITGAFVNCKKLKSISPAALLGTNYTSGRSLFSGCSALTEIPTALFTDGFEDVENFDECFYECTALTSVPYTLFDQATNAKSFVRAFYWDNYIASEVPPLWERADAVGTECFYNCIRAENYWDIPATWR